MTSAPLERTESEWVASDDLDFAIRAPLLDESFVTMVAKRDSSKPRRTGNAS